MSESQLLPRVSKKVERAMELRARGHSWRAIARMLHCDRMALKRAFQARGVSTDLPEESRRAYFAKRNSELLELAYDQTEEALEERKITPGQMPVTLGILTDKQVKLEGWDRQQDQGHSEAMLRTLAEVLLKARDEGLRLAEPQPIDAKVVPEEE